MTKKMLVKTESVDMIDGWMDGWVSERVGEWESWCKETDLNESFHQKWKRRVFFVKVSFLTELKEPPIHLLNTQTHTDKLENTQYSFL